MPIKKQTCPHCRTQNVAFNFSSEWRASGEKRALFTCGSCSEGIICEVFTGHSLPQLGGDLERHPVTFGRQWPLMPSGAAPSDTPPTIARYFEQGTSSLESANFDAAGMMFRKTLESATKFLDPDLSSRPHIKRIDSLASSGRLTSDMATWAHEVRLGGNDAAHEDDPFTVEEALDLKNFIENFLRYAFTLPSAVKRRSGSSEAE